MRSQVIFDLDDTLIGSFEGYSLVHRKAARVLGLPELSHEELAPYTIDFPTTLQAQYGHLPGFDTEVFIAEWDRIADEHPYEAIAGVKDALCRLREEGRELWIVTSRSRRRLAQRMAEGGIPFDWFRGVFPREDQPRQKPHPDCFEPIWRVLGKRPGHPELRVLFVGDRVDDQRAAGAAGIPFVAVRSGPEAKMGFPSEIVAGHVVDTAAEIPEWLSRYGY